MKFQVQFNDYRLIWPFAILGVFFDVASAQQDPATDSQIQTESGKDEEVDDNIIRKPKDLGEVFAKEYSTADKQKACKSYNNKIVSVGGEMWKVQNCIRYQIHDADNLFKMTRMGTPVLEADSRALAPIEVGPSWESMLGKKPRSCSQFNGRYITNSYTDIYFVDRCSKHLVPDYETFVDHRRGKKNRSQEILAVSDVEFHSIKQGADVASIMDKEFSKLLDGSAGVDIIPIDEACRGVEGKLVSFYSRIYRIEKCRKREIDAEAYSQKYRSRAASLKELRDEQWLSLPDGTPTKP